MEENQDPPSRSTLVVIGLATSAAGFYFILVSLGVLPVPGGPKSLHGPLWVVFCAGVAFLLAGISVAVRGFASDSALPAATPRWSGIAQHLVGLAVGACLASIGTWIAIGPGSRSFSVSAPFFAMSGAEAFGRIAFGIGALVVWMYVIGVAVGLARKIARRN